jgi:hypothetical protein
MIYQVSVESNELLFFATSLESIFLTYSVSFFILSSPLSQVLFWMLALRLSASVSLQNHKMWSSVSLTLQKRHSLLSCLFMFASLHLFIFFVSLFHSISFFLFFILFPLFCHVVFLVFLSFVLFQLIKSCRGYFSAAKRSSSRAAFAALSAISFQLFPFGHPEMGDFLSFFLFLDFMS